MIWNVEYPAPGGVVALRAARPGPLHIELLTQPLLAELAPVTSQHYRIIVSITEL